MTEDDIREQVAALAAATGRDRDDLTRVPLAELVLQSAAWTGAAADRAPTPFDQLVTWMTAAAAVMGPLGTIAGAIAAGVGVVGAVKSA